MVKSRWTYEMDVEYLLQFEDLHLEHCLQKLNYVKSMTRCGGIRDAQVNNFIVAYFRNAETVSHSGTAHEPHRFSAAV